MPKLKKILKRVIRSIPAVVGIVGGTALGGPAGAIAGGGLGNALTKSGKNKLKGALQGAGMGALYGATAPSIYQAFGGSPASSGFLPSITGIHYPSLLHQLGFKSAPGIGGGLGFYGNFGNKGLLQKGIFEEGVLGGIPGGNLLKPYLGSALSQLRKGQNEYGEGTGYDPQGYSESIISYPEAVPAVAAIPEEIHQNEQQKKINAIMSNKNSSALEKLAQILQILEKDQAGKESAAQTRNIVHRENSPQKVAAALNRQLPQFKRGGPVKAVYIKGNRGGQDDNVPKRIKPGSFVMDATTISLYGDGNSENGAKKLREDLKNLENSFIKSPFIKQPPESKNVRLVGAKFSPGELIIDKDYVDMVGNGDNKKGSKVFNNFRKNLRKHKGVVHFLPKKSKPFNAYARGAC